MILIKIEYQVKVLGVYRGQLCECVQVLPAIFNQSLEFVSVSFVAVQLKQLPHGEPGRHVNRESTVLETTMNRLATKKLTSSCS